MSFNWTSDFAPLNTTAKLLCSVRLQNKAKIKRSLTTVQQSCGAQSKLFLYLCVGLTVAGHMHTTKHKTIFFLGIFSFFHFLMLLFNVTLFDIHFHSFICQREKLYQVFSK